LAPLGQFVDATIGFHGVHLMSDQLNVLPGVPSVGINPIDTRIGRNVTLPFGKREWYSAQGTKSVLILQEKGQKAGVNGILHFTLPCALSGTACDVGEMVIDAAGMVASLLVL
jgi:hypothetical protein